MALSTIKTASIANNAVTTDKIVNDGNLGSRNIIKNGAMVVAQRATSVTGDTAGGSVKTVDRMNPEMNAAGTWTQSQSTDVPSGQGFVNSFKLDCTTADASLAANDYVAFGHRLEGLDLQRLNYGTSGAKNSVLSFWVKTNKTGNYVVGVQNVITGSTTKNCSFLYTVSQANTWQKIEFPIPADTAAAFDNDANQTAIIYWWLAVGSNYNTGTLRTTWTNNVSADFAAGLNVNLADSTDNEWYITGIQWEEGDVATPFEHEDFGTTLAKCQRYYYYSGFGFNNPGGTDSGSTDYEGQIFSVHIGSNRHTFFGSFPVFLRGLPTLTFYSPHDGASANAENYTGGGNISISASYSRSRQGLGGYSQTSTSGDTLRAYVEANAEL